MAERKKIGLLVIFSACLTGCANLMNVRTFGDATKTVSASTEIIIIDDQASCERRGQIISEYYNIVNRSAPAHDCSKLETVLMAVHTTNQSLSSYASVLSSLAQDTVVTYTAEGTDAANILKNVPGVTSDQATAVGDLAAFAASAATNGYRQREIDQAMTGRMAVNFKTTITVLQQLAVQYQKNLDTESESLILSDLGLDKFEVKEPLAGAEYELRLNALRTDIKTHQSAMIEYTKALTAMIKAFDDAVTDLNHPTTEQLLNSVKGFAMQANTVRLAMLKAFPNL